MTIIPERRSDTDFIALFLAGILLLAAWRGAENEPVITVVLAAISAVILGGWIYMRMTPRFALTIGPDEIVYGRPNERRTVITRGATDVVLIEYAGENGLVPRRRQWRRPGGDPHLAHRLPPGPHRQCLRSQRLACDGQPADRPLVR